MCGGGGNVNRVMVCGSVSCAGVGRGLMCIMEGCVGQSVCVELCVCVCVCVCV